MIYSLVKYLDRYFDIPGTGMIHYLSFRAAMAIIAALLIGIIAGRKIIGMLARHQIGEEIRTLGLQGEEKKKGIPTMGGIIILLSAVVPMLLFGDLGNIYVQLLLVATVWLGALGFADDYIKVFRHDKNGLKGRWKIAGQAVLGIIVGTTMWLNADIVVREKVEHPVEGAEVVVMEEAAHSSALVSPAEKCAKTTIPFIKDNEFDYHWLVPFEGRWADTLTWILYILMATLVITAVSNGANLTDGLDGLATGVSASVMVVLAVLAYLSGHVIYADYLNIMYIPDSGELTVFAAAMVGALMGFLWYNGAPAQVFMGDTGSLAIGGIIATLALLIRKELLLPLLCGVFLVESVSSMLQTWYFKRTKRRCGQGKRIFLMAPLHHHYQKKGFDETKIVIRFWLVQILLAALTLVTLKIR